MSAPVTEAHRELARTIRLRLTLGQAYQAIADSEAKAYDQLRAERDKLLGYYHEIVAELGDDLALKCIRDLRAEMEQLKEYSANLENDVKYLTQRVSEGDPLFLAVARAERAELERDQLRAQVSLDEKAKVLMLKGHFRDVDEMTKLRAEVERLTAEVANQKVQNNHNWQFQEISEEALKRAERAESELANIRALANRRNKRDHSQDTTHQLVAALDQALDIARAELAEQQWLKESALKRAKELTEELAAERARLRQLALDACRAAAIVPVVWYPEGYYVNPNDLGKINKQQVDACVAAIDAAMKEENK